jgi:hypothetical protein
MCLGSRDYPFLTAANQVQGKNKRPDSGNLLKSGLLFFSVAFLYYKNLSNHQSLRAIPVLVLGHVAFPGLSF